MFLSSQSYRSSLRGDELGYTFANLAGPICTPLVSLSVIAVRLGTSGRFLRVNVVNADPVRSALEFLHICR